MYDVTEQLKTALKDALTAMGVDTEPSVQEVPADKSGDYGSPVAFGLAKTLRKNPALIAAQIVKKITLPEGVAQVEAVGPYINFHLDKGSLVQEVLALTFTLKPKGDKVIVEHTSVNPNKEAHLGHLRNIVLGDTMARIMRAAGYTVEVQNYIDDTGRQAAESLFAIDYFKAEYDGQQKYDHWLGELYVRLGKAKEVSAEEAAAIEKGVQAVMHRLERGELREAVARTVYAQLQSSYALGVEYDLLVWESDVVASGFLQRGLEIVEQSPHVLRPEDGKFAGAMVMDVSAYMPGLEEPLVVLVRSDGNAMYVAKDIGYHCWKVGLFEGMTFAAFDTQPSGKVLYSSSPEGELHPDDQQFAHGRYINVIDTRQSHPQAIVRAALSLASEGQAKTLAETSHHLAYEVVTLEGAAMSGRKGITLAMDAVVAEAQQRAKTTIEELNPTLPNLDAVAYQVGVGALRFSMLKHQPQRIFDFRWEQAFNLQGDSAPYVQYAHARACKLLRSPDIAQLDLALADWQQVTQLEGGLAQEIAKWPQVLSRAAEEFAPQHIAQYALELATAWNGYYNHKNAQGQPDTRVLDSPDGLKEARVLLVMKVRDTLAYALHLLGIEAPQEM